MRIRKLTRSSSVFLLALTLVAPFGHSNTEPKKGRITANPTKGNKYSVEQDVELGRQVAGEAEKRVKVLPANLPAISVGAGGVFMKYSRDAENGRGSSRSLDRRPAKSIELQGKSAIVENGRPLPERVKLLAVSVKKGIVIYMVFVAPEVDFEMLRPVFDQVVRNFQVR